jgi:hypothetical protein
MSKAHTIYGRLDFDDESAGLSGASSGPTGSTNGLVNLLYLKEPGCADPISIGDINQGQLGDCFLLSSLGEIARQSVIQDNLYFIPSMIKVNGNGTETVKLYQETASVGGSPVFPPVYENVTNVFSSAGVNNGPTQDVVGNQKEIWPQVIEKAYAQLEGGYAAIADGGFPFLAMETLTGKAAVGLSPLGITLSRITAFANGHDLLTFDTSNARGLPNNLVSDHSYMFEGFSGSGASTEIKLGNPWGFDQPSPIPLSQIAAGTSGVVRIDVGHFSF